MNSTQLSLSEANARRAAVIGATVAAAGVLGTLALKVLDTPSRPYDAEANTVGNEYDAWTEVSLFVSEQGEGGCLGQRERRKMFTSMIL